MRLRALVAALPIAVLLALLSYILPTIPPADVPWVCLQNTWFTEGANPDGVPLRWEAFHGDLGVSYRWDSEFLFNRGADGRNGVALVMSTVSRGESRGDHYVGIHQTAPLVPGREYQLVVKGRVHSSWAESDVCRDGCVVQWAVGPRGIADATQVGDWNDMSLQPLGSSPGRGIDYVHTLRATSSQTTLFVRVLHSGQQPGGWIALALEEVSLKGDCLPR